MTKSKKLLTVALAAMTTALAVPSMGASAAPPATTDPQIYVDFTIVD